MNNIDLHEILWKLRIESLNPMQEEIIQAYRKGDDLVLLSPTGSGKTLAYLIPLVQHLDSARGGVQAVVLVPSRELALQTEQVFKSMGTAYKVVSCYGGRPAMDEHRTLRSVQPQVVVATPGRMNDHLSKGNIPVENISTLVIDEFDKCLELGFQEEMSQVISKLPKLKRRFLLSATDAPQIPNFVSPNHFVKLNYLSEDEQTVDRVSLYQVFSPVKDKLETLERLIRKSGATSSLVFVNYRESVERVGNYLKQRGIYCELFHGGMEQKDRERALYKFCNGSCNVFVSTDLAARGLDIPDIGQIIHYHLPLNEDAYIHRNGRTARWDAEGRAYMILGPEEKMPEYIRDEVETYRIDGKLPAPVQPNWVTLYIGKGKKDKINKVDIVGFLSKIGGLGREELGRIDVKEHYSFVAVSRKKLKSVLQNIRGQKIKGIKCIIEEAL